MKTLWLLLFVLLAAPAQATVLEEAESIASGISPYLDGTSVIIQGSYATLNEKLILNYLQDSYDDIAEVPVIEESGVGTLAQDTIILLGGPNQNAYSAFVTENYPLVEEHSISLGDVKIHESENISFIIFSDRAGYGNLPQTAVDRSPLRKYIPRAFIPLAAGAATLLLFWLARFLLHIIMKIFRFKLARKLMEKVKKKQLKKHFVGVHVFGMRIKLREWISIFLAAAVFAVSASYLYIFKQDLLVFVLVNIVMNALIYAIRHGVRLYLDKRHGIHTEYVFWYWGALLTVFSGWLGNTFSLAGYMVSDADDKKKKEGPIAFTINMITFGLFIMTGIWNLLAPNIAIQMAMMLSIGLTFLFMLPMKPFSGRFIYSWNKVVWWVSFIPITICYVAVSLIV